MCINSISAQLRDTVFVLKTEVVVKKEVHHFTDTIRLVDTIERVVYDTLVIRDTLREVDTVYQKPFKQKKIASNKQRGASKIYIGPFFGSSLSIDNIVFKRSKKDYFQLHNESIDNLLTHAGGIHGRWFVGLGYIRLQSKYFQFRQKITHAGVKHVNSHAYLDWNVGYGFELFSSSSDWKVNLELATGFSHLISQKGHYIDPENTSVLSTSTTHYPLRSSLPSHLLAVSIDKVFTDKLSISIQPFYSYRYKSLTRREHPVLYYRSELGMNLMLNYKLR